jgi:hypothetical protein
LFLGSNKIEVNGCVAIAEALKVNKSLTKLDLQGTVMGNSGALALADALRNNTTLLSLIVELDNISGKNNDGYIDFS